MKDFTAILVLCGPACAEAVAISEQTCALQGTFIQDHRTLLDTWLDSQGSVLKSTALFPVLISHQEPQGSEASQSAKPWHHFSNLFYLSFSSWPSLCPILSHSSLPSALQSLAGSSRPSGLLIASLRHVLLVWRVDTPLESLDWTLVCHFPGLVLQTLQNWGHTGNRVTPIPMRTQHTLLPRPITNKFFSGLQDVGIV